MITVLIVGCVLAVTILTFGFLLRNEIKKNRELCIQVDELQSKQRQILANITHELRTPLSIVLGQADILKNWVQKENFKGQLKAAQAIYKNGQSILNSLNSILNSTQLQKIEEDQSQIFCSC